MPRKKADVADEKIKNINCLIDKHPDLALQHLGRLLAELDMMPPRK